MDTFDELEALFQVALKTANLDEAERDAKAGLQRAYDAKDRHHIASFRNLLGTIYFRQGKARQALPLFLEGLNLRQELENKRLVADSLLNVGSALFALGQYEQTLDYFRKAYIHYQSLGEPQDLLDIVYELGKISVELCDFVEARHYLEQGLTFLEADDNIQRADIYNAIGIADWRQGRYEAALRRCQQALELIKGNEDPRAPALRAYLWNNVAGVYMMWGQPNTALNFFEQATLLLKDQPNVQEYILSLNNLGQAYHELGDRQQAMLCYNRARSAAEAVPHHAATSLLNMGGLYRDEGDLDTALQFVGQGIRLFKDLREPANIAVGLDELGRIMNQSGRSEEALAALSEALDLKKNLGDRRGMAITWAEMGTASAQSRDFASAQAAFASAIKNLESVAEELPDPSQVGSFQNIAPRIYARYAWMLLEMNMPEEALMAVERGRGQGLARQADAARTRHSTLQGKDRVQMDAAALELRRADRLLQAIQSQPEPDDAEEYRTYRVQVSEAVERVQRAEREYRLVSDSTVIPSTVVSGESGATLECLKTMALRQADTLYLEWAVVDDETMLLFALSARWELRSWVLRHDRFELRNTVQHWRAALTALSETQVDRKREAALLSRDEEARAKRVSQLLLARLEEVGLFAPGSCHRLVIVADEPLLDIPFSALLLSDGTRLITRYAVSNDLSLSQQATAKRSVGVNRLLLVADPFGGNDEGSAGSARQPPPDPSAMDQADSLRTVWEVKEPLHWAREEARHIQSLFPEVTALYGADATETAVKQHVSNHSLLHFATHGKLNVRSGLRSALMLAPDTQDHLAPAGILEGQEIVLLNIQAKLAVLSGCESGLGQPSGGEGLLGLVWAFRAAGCPSVVASHWEVRDRSSQELMVAFYRHLADGARKDDALQAAMLHVRKTYPSPYHWAAFSLFGQNLPVTG